MAADASPAPLSPGLLKVLRAVDRLGAHDALMAVQPDIVAIEAEQHPETVKHLLSRLHGHGMLDRAASGSSSRSARRKHVRSERGTRYERLPG